MLKVLGLIPSTKTKQEFKLKVYWGEDRNLELPQNKECVLICRYGKGGTVELKSNDRKKTLSKRESMAHK
jgi:hypothetical protein